MLDGSEVVDEILDALARRHLVAVLEDREDGAPNGHIGRAVGGDGLTKAYDAGDVFGRKFAVVAQGQSSEIRRRCFQDRGDGTGTSAVEPMA